MKWNGLNSLIEKLIKQRIHQLSVLSIILLVSVGCTSQSIEQGGPVDTFTQHLDNRVLTLMDWYNIPGTSIALVTDGKLVWSNAYGYADIDRGKAMSVDAICRAESISKPVTAWGVMKLVERGLFNLDDPVQQYLRDFSLPESEYNINDVTIRRLLSNSAGMPLGSFGEEYSPNSEKPSLRQYLRKEVHLEYVPGTKFEYSNPGFNLLELLIEEVTGRDFNEYMENEVLLPLGMHNSSFNWNEEMVSRVPMGYDLKGKPISPYVYPYKASGGLFSTVEDIARFAIAEIPTSKGEQKVLNEESLQAMQSPHIETSGIYGFVAEAYGFGHFIETLPGGKKAIWHGGQGHGWMTHFHIIPETGDGIVIFTNSQRSWPFMATILKEWSEWTGEGTVKFSVINKAVVALWIVTGAIFLIALYLGGKAIYGLFTNKRRLLLSLHHYSKIRVIEFILWAVLTAILLWSVSQDYLFISSIFPAGASLLGWGLLLLSFVLLFSIIFPIYESSKYSPSRFSTT